MKNELGEPKGIYFCTDAGYCGKADITLRQTIDIEADQTFNCAMDTAAKQEIYQDMLAKKEAVLKPGTDGENHAAGTGKWWLRTIKANA